MVAATFARTAGEANSFAGIRLGGSVDAAVICVGTSHPGNVGAVARGAANFGVSDLRFVAPRCDIHSTEALNRAVHARDNLAAAKVFDTLAEALAGTSMSVGTTARTTLAENRFLRKTLDVRDWASDMQGMEGTIGLVFGREDSGLNAEEVNQLDQLVTVPTANYTSLNLAHAVSILCYETWRLQAENITVERTLAPDTLHAMNRAWDDIVSCTESRHWRKDVASGIWRKMMGRSQPSDFEVHNIMGILGNVLKRFGHPDWATPGSKRLVAADGLRAIRVDEEE
jgi:tRNA/rRNA methyltransferase